MREATLGLGSSLAVRLSNMPVLVWLGVAVGIVMPMAAAAAYPTYMHQMEQPWLEWTRLMELPFVAGEMVVIHIALRRGMQDREVWRRLPYDVKWAFGLLLVGLAVSSLLTSKNPGASLALSLFTLVHVRFAVAVFHLVRTDGSREIDAFVPLLAFGLILLASLTAWKFAFPPPEHTVFGGKIEWGSALPGFISVRHFGSWTGAIAAGLLVALLYRASDRPATWLGAFYVLALGLTVWSGTRAALLAVAVVWVIFAITLRSNPKLSRIPMVLALTATASLAALCLPAPSPEFSFFRDYADANGASSGRLVLWMTTFSKWLEAPLFGWGSGSTFWEVNIGWAHTQPHNVILQYLISWGLFGTAGGLWLLGRAIVAIHRRGVTDEILQPLTGVTYALLFMSLLEGMLHYPRFIMVIMIGFAVVLARQDADRALSPLTP